MPYRLYCGNFLRRNFFWSVQGGKRADVLTFRVCRSL